ncbi:MAG: DNA gyrase inhibitor YacG [Nitrospina sp.]|nr:DNA gyrase inhibitor YacG [Nitrospinota bacterium]TDJ60022.1 MAG: DNA gyrase inhibitor YacG [Nitrospina sp.]
MTPTSRHHPKCPTCKKPAVKKDNAFFPFCCERCRLIDLGQWLDDRSLDREGKLADRCLLLTFPGRN